MKYLNEILAEDTDKILTRSELATAMAHIIVEICSALYVTDAHSHETTIKKHIEDDLLENIGIRNNEKTSYGISAIFGLRFSDLLPDKKLRTLGKSLTQVEKIRNKFANELVGYKGYELSGLIRYVALLRLSEWLKNNGYKNYKVDTREGILISTTHNLQWLENEVNLYTAWEALENKKLDSYCAKHKVQRGEVAYILSNSGYICGYTELNKYFSNWLRKLK